MSAIGTFNYKLAKFLVPIFQPLTCNQYTVQSSFPFVNEITQLTLSHDAVMVSFDVPSLFTNIPLDETVNIILDNHFSGTDEVQVENCVFSKPQFKKLHEFAVKSDHFIINNHLYGQTDEVAMGSPSGPSFANIFMCALEQNFLSNCPSNYKPIFYRRFVDDTFCIFQNHTQVECFLNSLNRQHPNIEFTQELEENNSLPFLDTLVTLVENGFTTNLYRKKTFTGLYTHFDSLSPVQYKINLISVLIYRAFHICSSYKAFHSQICNIKQFLQQNRFPAKLIDRIIKRFLNKQYVVDIKPSNVPKLPILLFLPYLGVYSILLKKRLTKFIGKIYPPVDLKIVFQASKPIGRLFPFKDRVPSHICSPVIYKFTCSSCQATYYGKTSCHFIVCFCWLGFFP